MTTSATPTTDTAKGAARRMFRESVLARLTKPAASLTSDERAQLRDVLVQAVAKRAAAYEAAKQFRPSYAPPGRATREEMGTKAMLANAEEVLWACDEWLAGR